MASADPVLSARTSPLPPVSDFGDAKEAGNPPSALAGLISGILPVKTGVDAITDACKQIVQSGAIPGAEQICGQIMALASSMIPMAAQQLAGPGAGSGGPQPASPGGLPGMGAPAGPGPVGGLM